MSLLALAQLATALGGLALVFGAIGWFWRQTYRIHELLENSRLTEKRSRELEHNGGSSMKDSLARIERRFVVIEDRLSVVEGRKDVHERPAHP